MLNDGTLEGKMRIENLQELLSVCNKYNNQDTRTSLTQLLEDISLIEAHSEENNPNAVTLMTVHAAKGLEFKYVFLVGMEENLFPHSQSSYDQKELEEERRLAYVAITRAKNKLWMTYTENRTYFGRLQSNANSRFINDIPAKYTEFLTTLTKPTEDEFWDDYTQDDEKFELPDLKEGDLIKHEIFGKGKVVEINDYMITIDFGSGKGQKELALEYARLEKI